MMNAIQIDRRRHLELAWQQQKLDEERIQLTLDGRHSTPGHVSEIIDLQHFERYVHLQRIFCIVHVCTASSSCYLLAILCLLHVYLSN